jgi:putative acyl-CoA dehydrogenase
MNQKDLKMNQNSQANPGLEKFDLSEYKSVSNQNFFTEDQFLQRIIQYYTKNYAPEHKKDMLNHLEGYGKLVGGILNELTNESHKENKYGQVIQYDKTGNRIDKIEYCKEQLESRKISFEYGIVNLDFHKNWKHEFTSLHRVALAYLANQNGEGGVTCPLAMTEGMILALKEIGTEEQKRKYLPLVAHETSKSYFMAGQYVTERVGGSNVSANRTIAKKNSNGKWILNGEKWFCSNPGDIWVTTAKIEGTSTIGLFLVPRLKEDGSLNGAYILRKKDIIGSRGKLTVEVVYDNLEAEEFGRPTHGIANLIKYIIRISRIHVCIAATGMGRRALMEAMEYVKYREAYGKKIGEFNSLKKELVEMKLKQMALTWSLFRNIEFSDLKFPVSELLTPLLKYSSTIHATWITHKAILVHGGNGIINDFSPLPRLHNDSIINETWEGTHLLLADHVRKAFKRKKVQENFWQIIHSNKTEISNLVLVNAINQWEEEINEFIRKEDIYQELNKLEFADVLYKIFTVSEISRNREIFTDTILFSYYEMVMNLKEKTVLVQPKPDFSTS